MSSGAHRKLCTALLRHAPYAVIDAARERPWASITFTGARHWLTLSVPAHLADTVARDLPEAQLPLAGHIVADLVILRKRPQGLSTALEIEALTVEVC